MMYWKPENLMYINTDEFKYLSKISEVINESEYITASLKEIKNIERLNIQSGALREIYDFEQIKIKLNELYNIINEYI